MSSKSDLPAEKFPGWQEAGFQTLKRTVRFPLSRSGRELPYTGIPPHELAILVPDLIFCLEQREVHNGYTINGYTINGNTIDGGFLPEKFLFFDLETTGLGGSGTVAFLAAFGRLSPGAGLDLRPTLRIDQYLLLDFPGEYDFLTAVVSEFNADQAGCPPLVVTYNGKAFDSQILKTRCLMNGIETPEYRHADLLHPSRRLWKRMLPDCSQAQIETSILGLDRTGDIPGALAPEIWFNFLKNGENEGTSGSAVRALLGICEHNARDISGLAGIFCALSEIAAAPQTAERYFCDTENLALQWRKALRRNGGLFEDSVHETGKKLLENAVLYPLSAPRAALVLGADLLREASLAASDEEKDRLLQEGRRLLLEMSRNSSAAVQLRCLALRSLAVDAEHRRRDNQTALAFVETALQLEGLGGRAREDLLKRQERLKRSL
ncbi:hypothetical protein FACS1894151_01550 [Spirochaetia bacterium]|nr:hypothetical protein FACS1894151_01550 [Spirochaetia bacterium]